MQSRCRGADTEMQMCRGADVQRCRGAEVQEQQRGCAAEVHQKCIRSAAEVWRCIYADRLGARKVQI
jgi:hypothetical protein